jgi:SAM-dependent methyltransferase
VRSDCATHIHSITMICRCLICSSSDWIENENSIVCRQCGKHFLVNECSIDFIEYPADGKESPGYDKVFRRALENWGESLHNDPDDSFSFDKGTGNYSSFDDLLGVKCGLDRGMVLDIGCGLGVSLSLKARENPQAFFYGIDIGANIPSISRRDSLLENLSYLRGNALDLPIQSRTIDSVLSMGVFHHTDNPQKCLDEAFRVLKSGGCLGVYLYKNHEDNIIKYLGVMVEGLLLRAVSKISIKQGRIVCWILSPIILAMFSWPSQVLKRIPGLSGIGHAFPLHWGTTPASIVDDLQDRLVSPVNHRYSRKNVEDLLRESGFTDIEVITVAGGHFGYGKKI